MKALFSEGFAGIFPKAAPPALQEERTAPVHPLHPFPWHILGYMNSSSGALLNAELVGTTGQLPGSAFLLMAEVSSLFA